MVQRDIVWLASYPKSGNTWLRVLLANWIADLGVPVHINHLGKYGLGLSDNMPMLWEHVCGAAIPPLDVQIARRADVQRALPAWVRAKLGTPPGKLLVKTHNAAVAIRGHAAVAPDVTAAAIYIVRDPRSVVVSLADYMQTSLEDAVAFMKSDLAMIDGATASQHVASWSSHVRSWRSLNALIVRYEDLPRDFARPLRYLGLGEDSERFARAVQHSSLPVLQDQERADGFRGYSAQFFGASHRTLPEALARQIEADHGAVMRELNYMQ